MLNEGRRRHVCRTSAYGRRADIGKLLKSSGNMKLNIVPNQQILRACLKDYLEKGEYCFVVRIECCPFLMRKLPQSDGGSIDT